MSLPEPDQLAAHKHYHQIASAICYLNEHQINQPTLSDLASASGLSEYHLQRTFTQWVGISPKQFLQYLTKEHAKSVLRQSTVLDTAHTVGLSGSSRLHDLMISHESVTPGEYKAEGQDLKIYYAAFSSLFGYCFMATTERGICKISFFDRWSEFSRVLGELRGSWPKAKLLASRDRLIPDYQKIFEPADCAHTGPRDVRLLLKGTEFRVLVWEALMRLESGALVSYQQLARGIGKPTATRAVASAIAQNELAYVIPCHRVIRETGVLNQYRWGRERKAMLIAREAGGASGF